MSRFTGAARALRGPFKKLIRKFEMTLRRPAITKLGWVGRAIAKRQGSRDARAALRAAQEEAARLRSGRRPPAAASAAVDRTTGRVVAVGHCRHSTPVPPQLSAKFPNPPLETRWPVDNCGEVDVAAKAMRLGSKLEDLVIRTVHTKDGTLFPPCDNCNHWVPGKD